VGRSWPVHSDAEIAVKGSPRGAEAKPDIWSGASGDVHSFWVYLRHTDTVRTG